MGLDRDQVSRNKRVIVQQHGDHVHEEHIVQDTNLELRQTVYKAAQLVWLLFGSLEGLIGLRVILKLIAANPNNLFTFFVYQLTDFFLWPFLTITGTPSFQGHALEIPAIIAMFVYALLGWIIVRLIWVIFYRSPTSQVTTYDREQGL